MTSSDDDLEGLRRLASDRRESTSGAAKPGPRASGAVKPAAAAEDLASVLAGRAAASSAQPIRRTQAPGDAPAKNESLEQLARAGSVAQPRVITAPTASVSAAEVEGIEGLAHPVSPVRPQPATPPKVMPQEARRNAPADFLLKEAANMLPAAPAPSTSSRFSFNRPFSLKHVLIAALLLWGAGLAIYQHQPGKVSFPSPLAAQVAKLAAAVDAHYAEKGSMPESLVQLATFPPDALQWPMQNYGLRLMDRRTEFFFDGASSDDYVLIGRLGEEAWAFAKGMQPQLLQVPAH